METLRERCEKLKTQLLLDRSTWEPHWQDLGDYILPWRIRFKKNQRNKGDKRNSKIIDNTATLAVRTARSGMMSGTSNPARPWFRLTTPDPDLAENGAVKQWLHTVTMRMNAILLKSNYYNSMPYIYGDLIVFGTAPRAIMEDEKDIIRCYNYPIGTYALGGNDRLEVDTIVREEQLTVRQIVQKFARYDLKTGKPMWDNISLNVRNAWDNSNYENLIDIVHVVKPNDYKDKSKLEARYKPFISLYYETSSDKITGGFLRQSGFEEFPLSSPRWELLGNDVYGYCPGMDTLGDCKALQLYHKKKAKAIDKTLDPPMTAPTSMRNSKASLLPGDITYIDDRTNGQGFKPAHEINFNIRDAREDIAEHQKRISRGFYEDLFLMLAMSDRRQITATEVAERHEEKLLALGPVLQNLNTELYDSDIDRVFNIMVRRKQIPEPPKELAGVNLRVEYISILHQAQKLVGMQSVQKFAGYVGSVAQYKQDAIDKIDIDQSIDEVADMLGVPPRLVRSDDQVQKIREERQQQMAQQQQIQQAQMAAQTAKDLSQAKTTDSSALTQLLGQGQTPGGQAA